MISDIIKIVILIWLIVLDLYAIGILILCEKIAWIEKVRKEDVKKVKGP